MRKKNTFKVSRNHLTITKSWKKKILIRRVASLLHRIVPTYNKCVTFIRSRFCTNVKFPSHQRDMADTRRNRATTTVPHLLVRKISTIINSWARAVYVDLSLSYHYNGCNVIWPFPCYQCWYNTANLTLQSFFLECLPEVWGWDETIGSIGMWEVYIPKIQHANIVV